MNTNFYEAELRKALKADFESGHLREIGNSDHFFEQLEKAYPGSGSKIDWAHVPDSIEQIGECASLPVERFIEFFDAIQAKFDLTGDVVYIGDSATDFALEGSITAMRKVLPELLTVPQHHYFIGLGCSWCMCFTMEDDMAFGFRALP